MDFGHVCFFLQCFGIYYILYILLKHIMMMFFFVSFFLGSVGNV